MELTLPVFVQVIKRRGHREPVHHAQLLFSNRTHAVDEVLQRAMVRLIRETKKSFDELGNRWNHQHLAAMVFNPDFKTRRLKLSLDLKTRHAKVNYFFVIQKVFGRRIVFTPTLPSLWFEVNSDEDIEVRATEVFQKYFREQIKEQGDEAPQPEKYAVTGTAWVTSIDVDVRTDQVSRKQSQEKLLSLWSNEEMNGNTELNRVGRCLDWLYPDDLEIAIDREDVVESLFDLLKERDRRPVLLVGPTMTGKTAIIHEVVRRRLQKRRQLNSTKRNVWLLSPQRIVSGMSYVGQWENRVIAIFKEAYLRDHVLYFDDVLGLFRAGQSRDSDLSVSDLLKNAMLEKQFRVLAEMTPTEYDKLTEIDRAFADLFHIIRIEPTGDDETLRIALQVQREQEQKHSTIFSADSLPSVIQLQRQYIRGASFPGKAARFIRQLAVKFTKGRVDRDSVLNEFCNSAGISNFLVDQQVTVRREDIIADLKKSIVGQEKAINACADVVSAAKAHLSDPNKPLATMLFLGPTGVGKTECAKTLSKYMFRSEEKLIRFDLNEFKSSYSAARLVGTPDEPEGLLTSAVRHQPFSVVLLDEIEKAHPDVFDILLQVTGEGRLTDSFGRTTDFTNTVVILTSNLGTKSSTQKLGFNDDDSETQHRFIKAAEKFFRPEFFNRLDHVIPFDHLTESQVESIAEHMMQSVISREGLVRRRCILQVGSNAIKKVVKLGFQPELGARALKRSVERYFTQPVAARLSAIQSEVPTLIRVTGGEGEFDVSVRPLENVAAIEQFDQTPDRTETIRATKSFLNRIKTENLGQRPSGEITSAGISPELLRYYAMDEQLNRVQEIIDQYQNEIEDEKLAVRRPELPIQGERIRTTHQIREIFKGGSSRAFLKNLNSVRDIKSYVSNAVEQFGENENQLSPQFRQLLNQCSLLELMTQPSESEHIFAFKLYGASLGGNQLIQVIRDNLIHAYYEIFKEEFDFAVESLQFSVNKQESYNLLRLSGSCLTPILNSESGFQMFCDADGKLNLMEAGIIEPNAAFTDAFEKQKELEAMSAGTREFRESLSDLPIPQFEKFNSQVIRMFDYRNRVIDFRTGSVTQTAFNNTMIHQMILSGLSYPKEFESIRGTVEESGDSLGEVIDG